MMNFRLVVFWLCVFAFVGIELWSIWEGMTCKKWLVFENLAKHCEQS